MMFESQRTHNSRNQGYRNVIGDGLSIAQVLTATQHTTEMRSGNNDENRQQQQQHSTTLSRVSGSRPRNAKLHSRGMPPLRERLLSAFTNKNYGGNNNGLAMVGPQSNAQLVATDGFYFQQRHGKLNLRGIARLDLEKVRNYSRKQVAFLSFIRLPACMPACLLVVRTKLLPSHLQQSITNNIEL
jgi:hypothetical protein